MQKVFIFILVLAATVILFNSCSADPAGLMEAVNTEWEAKNITLEKKAGSSLQISIAIASIAISELEATTTYEDGSYVLTCAAPKTRIFAGDMKIKEVKVHWFVNGLDVEETEDGSISVAFQHPGYRNITYIVEAITEDGYRLLGDSYTETIAYPMA